MMWWRSPTTTETTRRRRSMPAFRHTLQNSRPTMQVIHPGFSITVLYSLSSCLGCI
jgi:hypothetical protein